MILKTDYSIRKIYRKIKSGDAVITGTTRNTRDSDPYYIIDDLEDQMTHHLACWRRKTWTRFVAEGKVKADGIIDK